LDYCTVDNVKAVLQIGDDNWDSELSECVTSASALVDGFLSREGLSMPYPAPCLSLPKFEGSEKLWRGRKRKSLSWVSSKGEKQD
jgi:hypothetical protein